MNLEDTGQILHDTIYMRNLKLSNSEAESRMVLPEVRGKDMGVGEGQ